jgi:hypothetical protein
MTEYPNPDKPEKINYKHHLILKLGQINYELQYPGMVLSSAILLGFVDSTKMAGK